MGRMWMMPVGVGGLIRRQVRGRVKLERKVCELGRELGLGGVRFTRRVSWRVGIEDEGRVRTSPLRVIGIVTNRVYLRLPQAIAINMMIGPARSSLPRDGDRQKSPRASRIARWLV